MHQGSWALKGEGRGTVAQLWSPGNRKPYISFWEHKTKWKKAELRLFCSPGCQSSWNICQTGWNRSLHSVWRDGTAYFACPAGKCWPCSSSRPGAAWVLSPSPAQNLSTPATSLSFRICVSKKMGSGPAYLLQHTLVRIIVFEDV